MGSNERQKEIKRRRHRRKKVELFKQRLDKASPAEKAAIATKLRSLTPGAEDLIRRWQLEDQ